MEKKLKKPRTFKFCGKKFKIHYRAINNKEHKALLADSNNALGDNEYYSGYCDDRTNANPKIVLDLERLSEKMKLQTILDEAIHACDFTIKNDKVAEMALSISNFLIALGYVHRD